MRTSGIGGNNTSRLLDAAQKQLNRNSRKGTDFKNMVEDYVSEVDALQDKADKALQEIATGQTDNLHRFAIATNEAEMSFRFMMKIRNKLVEAYNEIMRMKV
jgi:flagellar hook-basal body complex protein FliE